ncbi:sensor histidine kinase [Microbacterium sp. CPCC 204701]|uniref:sensor histidine kinase n=1 Tax=Microbacterium sp. CPCC 204701 TaxID=2493084 RepID=UPI000FDACAF7|nr:ATP-binding protein [Microbacterium sp. CPCC 204701]
MTARLPAMVRDPTTRRSRETSTDAASRRAIAGTVWAVSWALALASLAIAWTAHLPAEPLPGVFLSQAPLEMRSRFADIGVTVALIYGPVSALILARRPHAVGVIIAIHAVGSSITAFGVQYGLLGAQTPGLPLWGLLAFAAGWGYVPGTFMTAALPILVTRRRIPRWQRGIVLLCAVTAGAAFFVSLTQQSVATPRNPLAIDVASYQAVLPSLYTAPSFLAVAISFVSCGILVARWWRARGRARAGLAWLTLGHSFLTLSYLALVLPEGLRLPRWTVEFGLAAPVLGQILYPAAILVVVLGQRLWGVELVVSRLLLWALLTFSGVAAYLVAVTVLPVTLAPVAGLSLMLPVLIAVAILPLRGWLQRRIDRLIYGEGADPAHLLARLGERIGELHPGAEGLNDLAHTLRAVLRLGWVAIRAGSVAAEAGRETEAAISRVPLTAGEEIVGELLVQPIASQRLDRRTLVVLADVAGLVTTVVRLAEAYDVLDHARGELVARRADERRSIRRELHDGLGPALAGIGFSLAAAQNLAPGHPERAGQLLAELSHDVHRGVRDVRDLANAVAPRPLDGDQLAEAFTALSRRFDSPSLRVRVIAEGASHLSAEVAQTLYFIAAEALANAARHAHAKTVTIAVQASAAQAVVEITDDGRGIPPGARSGIGMTSMRERAGAHGGDVTVSSTSGGTRLRASIPLPPGTMNSRGAADAAPRKEP